MAATFIRVVLAFFIFLTVQPSSARAEEQEGEWFSAIQVEKLPDLDAPYVPTPPEVVSKMLNMAGVNNRDILYDLGCGDGRIVVAAVKERNVRQAVGVDVDPKRIEDCRANARRAGINERVHFEQKDLFELDLRQASVVSLYLLPSVNLKLRPKLLRELQPGARIVSHDFDMGDWQPDKSASVNGHTIYYWMVPSNVNGTWTWTTLERGTSHRYELRLRQQFQFVESAELLLDDMPKEVVKARIAGDLLEFTAHVTGANESDAVHFSATVTGNSLKGVVEQAGSKKKWVAERTTTGVLPIDALSGTKVQL